MHFPLSPPRPRRQIRRHSRFYRTWRLHASSSIVSGFVFAFRTYLHFFSFFLPIIPVFLSVSLRQEKTSYRLYNGFSACETACDQGENTGRLIEMLICMYRMCRLGESCTSSSLDLYRLRFFFLFGSRRAEKGWCAAAGEAARGCERGRGAYNRR